jgi:hypothetical protein
VKNLYPDWASVATDSSAKLETKSTVVLLTAHRLLLTDRFLSNTPIPGSERRLIGQQQRNLFAEILL